MFSVRSLLSASILAAAAISQAYDAFTDFSRTANPNGVWRYGYDAGSGFTLFDGYTLSPNNVSRGWRSSSIGTFLGVYDGTTSLIQHPGPDGQKSILRFTAPVAGSYLINVAYGNGDNATTDWNVQRNGAGSLAGGNINGAGSTGFYTATLALAQGDTIDSRVGYGNGTDAQDSTTVAFNVQAVPEPSAFAAFGLGAVALLRRRRKV